MHWLRRFFRKEQSEKQLDRELRFHLERQIADYVAAGMSLEEARRRARLEFGGLEAIKQQTREARRANFLDTLWQDVRFGLRMLRKNPGFTAIAILTLASGIGANTALFSLLNGLVLRNLPVLHPEQLVHFGVHSPDDPFTALSLPMFEEISREQNVFSGTFAWWGDAVLNVETKGSLSRADVWAVEGRFFSELGAVPEMGRLLGPEDVDLKAPAPAQVAVLGHGFWQRHYGASPDVVGKTIKIEGLPFIIIGVTRRSFTGISADDPPELIIPLNTEPLLFGDTDVGKHLGRPEVLWIEAAGRLRSGATLEQARAQLESLWPSIQKSILPTDRTRLEITHFGELRMKVESGGRGSSFLRTRFSKPLYVVLGIAGVVLLVACVNLAGLLLGRAASRGHEMGVRAALGASRARLVCQMLTESVTLSLLGTVGGFVLASWSSHALADFILGQIYIVPASLNLSPDWRILVFTASVAVLTGVLFGLAPSWCASREDPQLALQQNARATGQGTGLLGRGLIVTQVALSLMLLSCAGLFIRSLEKLRNVDPGFRTSGLLNVNLFPRPGGYKKLDWVNYYRELTNRIAALPGVESAGMSHMNPGTVLEWMEKIRARGSDSEGVTSDVVMLMPGAFRALNINLLRGRTFTWQDDDHAPKVALVSENLAEKMFPTSDAIGKHLDIATRPQWQNLEIVGIVSNASLYDVRKHEPLTVYAPTTQYGNYMGWSSILVRTSVSPMVLEGPISQVVESLGHEYVPSVKTVEQNINRSILQERVTAMLSAFFGGLALLLAAIGVYGQMAYSVARRTREIGIRIALGARQGAVQQMVLREALGLAALGVAIGVPCAVVASRLIASMLFGLSPHDPATLALVVAVLLAASALAAYFPARRAKRVDPMVALRYE